MTFVTVMNQWLRDNVRPLVGYELGLVAMILIYLPLYPQFSDSGLLDAKIQALPKELIEALGLDEVLGGSGYTQATVYGLTFVLMMIAQVSNGARAIAGEERVGWATGVAIGVAFGGYFLNSLGDLWFDWAPRLSPFGWAFAHRPLVNGFDQTGLSYLLIGCGGLLLVAVIGFQRRDIHV